MNVFWRIALAAVYNSFDHRSLQNVSVASRQLLSNIPW